MERTTTDPVRLTADAQLQQQSEDFVRQHRPDIDVGVYSAGDDRLVLFAWAKDDPGPEFHEPPQMSYEFASPADRIVENLKKIAASDPKWQKQREQDHDDALAYAKWLAEQHQKDDGRTNPDELKSTENEKE